MEFASCRRLTAGPSSCNDAARIQERERKIRKTEVKVPQLILRCDHNRLLLLYFILSTNQTSCRESSWWVGSGHKGSIPSVYLSSQLLSQFKNGLLWVCFTSCSFTWSAFDLMVGHFPSNLASYLCLTVSVCYCAACIFCSDFTAPKLHTHQSHTQQTHKPQSLFKQWCSFLHTLTQPYDRVWLADWMCD